MVNLWLDVQFSLRQLRKSPGFALTAVLTLTLGIGATTALLRWLPFEVVALDPVVIQLAAVSIFVLARAASLFPARHVPAVQAAWALRGE
jgi:hypothetical protein